MAIGLIKFRHLLRTQPEGDAIVVVETDLTNGLIAVEPNDPVLRFDFKILGFIVGRDLDREQRFEMGGVLRANLLRDRKTIDENRLATVAIMQQAVKRL